MTTSKYARPHTLSGAVDMYIDSQQKADRTKRTMRTALNRLIYNLGADLELANIEPEDLIYYSESLSNDGLSYGTKTTYKIMVRLFFRWLILRGWASYDTADLERALETVKASNGRKPAPLPKLPPEDTVTAIIKEAETRTRYNGTDRQIWARLRDAAMLHVLRSTGVRAQELVDIQIGHVNIADGYILIPSGKGEKARYVFLDDRAKDFLSGWIYEHPDGGAECPVFIRLDHRLKDYCSAMTTESVRKILAGLCADVGLPAITPHQFRHRFGTAIYVAAGLGPTADLMGHADPAVTRVYAKLARVQMQGIHGQAEL